MAKPRATDALRLRPHGLDFEELKDLSEYLDQIQDDADASLGYFRHPGSGGFSHRVDPAKGATKSSKASTATCVAYLQVAGKLSKPPWNQRQEQLRRRMVDEPWDSAELGADNAFTLSFLLELIHASGGYDGLSRARRQIVSQKIALLNRSLAQNGGLSIKSYPRTSFLTQKAVRVLNRWKRLSPKAREAVSRWNWQHLYEESMLISSNSPDSDFFELAYAVLTASATTPMDRMTPRQRRLLQHALDQFFDGQRDDGTWPRSRPLFLYPTIGYAYCYDYELLVQLLSERQLRQHVFPHLSALRSAAWSLEARRVPLEGPVRAYGWSSEHHGKDFEAESWPTASVFHFCFELSRLVADAIRRDIFEYVNATYDEPEPERPRGPLLDGLLDSPVGGRRRQFKSLINESFVKPLIQERDQVRDGQQFGKKTKVSAIVYGPPGTSKTRFAGMVAKALGWPLLSLDPSHLTRHGLDNVHAEADALFGRLRFCDQLVVLLDEFDELVRERGGAGELESRFLTTAMLPKLAALHQRRRLVYIVATNHLEQFDAAISRPGRFDVIAPLMPPSTSAKFREWPALRTLAKRLSEADPPVKDINQLIGSLTYAEAEDLAHRIKGANGSVSVYREAVAAARRGATLEQLIVDTEGEANAPAAGTDSGENQTWKSIIRVQETKIRGLPDS